MSDLGFHLFATAIGGCGIVWNGRGVVGVQLPEKSERLTRARIERRLPPGETISRGGIGGQLGDRLLAREVADALSRNPVPLIVPCHRVLAAGGKMGGFSAPGGVRTKLRLLSIEGARYGGPTLYERLPWAAAPPRGPKTQTSGPKSTPRVPRNASGTC